MADSTQEVPAVTNPLAKGLATSEGKLTAFSVVMGIALSIFGAVQPMILDAQTRYPDSRWAGAAALLCGAFISAAGLFGYNKGRALIKSTQVAGLLQSGIPVVIDMVAQGFARSQAGKKDAPTLAPGPVLGSATTTPIARP